MQILRTFRRLPRHAKSFSVVSIQESRSFRFLPIFAISTAVILATSNYGKNEAQLDTSINDEESTTLLNWSGTHAVNVRNSSFWEPETIQQVEQIVQTCNKKGQPIRPIGSALSPNGIAFNRDGMISMANLDQIVDVDVVQQTVTVQAGARVSQVVQALRPYGLTLPNLASIAEQQMGGFVQVGAHGTGRTIAPVDHYVTMLKIVTPGKGIITLTEDDGEVFHLAKVGLGCIGVVVEITMKCIPAHSLVEHTFVLTREQAKDQLNELLKKHKHMRYMWIPYTESVVCVTNDPEDQVPFVPKLPTISDDERFRPLRSLLKELTEGVPESFTDEGMKGMGFGDLRDAILAINPLDIDHVKRCNQAEAEFWKKSEGYRIKPSDELLQFDCGGQQWVWEVCFSTGTQEENNGNDIDFMLRLMEGIEANDIPAHSPIEQRWSASSSSLMSPAYGRPEGLHSWVGIISYLPSDDPRQRQDITDLFTGKYCELLKEVGQRVDAASHWAKIERPNCKWGLLLYSFSENYG